MLRALLMLTLALAAGVSTAADVGLMPVSVHLDALRPRATVQVMNNGAQPVVMQVDTVAWQRENQQDSDAATTDLVVNPPVFTLAPGRTQIVRVGLRRAAQGEREGTYRMVLREVPGAADLQGLVSGQVRVLVAMRVPVYVAPSRVVQQERWQVERDPAGRTVATVHNDGNVHLKVGRLSLHRGDTEPPLAEQTVASLLFPGESQRFVLPAASQARRMEVVTNRGVQHVALDDTRR
ncbi:molecular chaperone [Aquabacterium sp. J223]|uniref:fimbrial biogenesis chaperone n=1 Tax=Aquabacterium sp. J223 TaxID=2898431 RepID=UPI0021ADEC97|nr:fimbria/pilus periplasmic chaperone [Aquabacterium sp. J223]UUX97690.1 fimbria/pilus periplasmic chaperone [Aquabacterium sp. J223]